MNEGEKLHEENEKRKGRRKGKKEKRGRFFFLPSGCPLRPLVIEQPGKKMRKLEGSRKPRGRKLFFW